MNRKKVFIVVSLLIVLLDSLFVFANYFLSRNALYEELAKESATLFNAFQASVADTEANLLMVASIFAHDAKVQSLFLAGKKAVEQEGGGAGAEQAARVRQALYEYVAPRWEHAMGKLGARQLHFHLGPGSLSFLRVHRPEKFGDRMDQVRFTIVDTNAQLSARSGFETGRVYSGIRGVVPVMATDPASGEGLHVGALEAGLSFNSLVDNFKQNAQTDISILLTRKHIESAMWPDFIQEKFNEQYLPGGFVVESSSRPLDATLFNENLLPALASQDKDIEPHIVQTDGRYLFAAHFPLRDYLGRETPEREDVGVVVLWQDITERFNIFRHTQWFNLAYALLAFLVIEIGLYLGFRRVTSFLEHQVESRTAALNASRSRLRTLIDATPDLICFKDGQGNWLEANEASLDLFGLREQEYQGKTNRQLAEMVHPAFREPLLQAEISDQAVWEERDLCRFEESWRPPDERERTFDFIRVPIFDSVGERQGLVVLGRDISDSKRARQALANSEARYRRFFADNKAPMLLLDPEDGWIVVANLAASRFYGYSTAELQQLNLRDIKLHSEHALSDEKTPARTQNRDYAICRHMMKNGDIRDVEVHSGAMELDERRLTYYIIHDVTERYRMEQALKASEAKYRQLFNSAPEGIWLTDQDQLTISVNPQLCLLLGYGLQQMLGQQVTEFMNDEARSIYAQQQRALAGGGREAYEITLLDKNGRHIPTLFSSVGLMDNEGEVYATLTFVTDLTERHHAQESLQQERELLQSVIDSVTDPILVVDKRYKLLLLNQAARQHLPDNIEEQPCIECSLLMQNKEQTQGCIRLGRKCPLKQAMTTQQPVRSVQRVRSPQGDWQMHEIIATPLCDSRGECFGVVETSRNISDRIETGEQQKDS